MRAFSSATRSEECKYSQLRFCTRVCKNSVSGNNISPKASTRSVKAICNDYVGEDNSFITSPRIVSSSDMVVSLLARFIEMLLDLSANFSMSLLFLLLRWSITFSSWQETYKFATITTTSPPSAHLGEFCLLISERLWSENFTEYGTIPNTVQKSHSWPRLPCQFCKPP